MLNGVTEHTKQQKNLYVADCSYLATDTYGPSGIGY